MVDPNWATLPARFRKDVQDRLIGRDGRRAAEPFTIAVTPLNTREPRWYTLADVIAAVLLGDKAPKVRRRDSLRTGRAPSTAVHEVPQRDRSRGRIGPIFKTIVEQKQIAKDAPKDRHDLAALALGLKEMANSGAYGIHAEVNVKPPKGDDPIVGDVYADITFEAPKVHNERPGAFANPILASLVTGGARLMLAMLEREVTDRGGTFTFCDTDSLAINFGETMP